MAITVKHSKVSTIPDEADTSLVRPSDWNADHTLVGLGTMAEQNANAVAITGGSINGTTVGATTASTGAFTTLSASTQLNLTNASNYNLYASGAGANYMAGSLGIGAVPTTSSNLYLAKNITGATVSVMVDLVATAQTDVTAQAVGFRSNISTSASAYTLTNIRNYLALPATIGAGSTVTNQIGFVATALTGATNNYAFNGSVAAATGSYNLYMNGTANNYMAGALGIGTTSPNASALLDVQSTTKGVRMPNMTTTQKNAISSPAAGLMVFDTTLAKLAVYSGTAWETVTSI
jgi:hypothetical protein